MFTNFKVKEENPKDYVLKEGDYRVSIRIWEASDLIPKESNGVADPYCIVKVGEIEKKTQYKKKMLSPLWDK